MITISPTLAAIGTIICTIFLPLIYRVYSDPLRAIPGGQLYGFTSWRLAYDDLQGSTTKLLQALHVKYGPVVRIGPKMVSFNSLNALKTIYGAGSRSRRTRFYTLFEPYGRPTMFTMSTVEDHRARKRLLAKPYAKTHILSGWVAAAIEARIKHFLNILQDQDQEPFDISQFLGFYSLDVATAFVYGTDYGTRALAGNNDHTALLDDYKNPFRRELSWLGVHGNSRLKTAVLRVLHSRPMPTASHKEQPFARIRGFARDSYGNAWLDLGHSGPDPGDISLLRQLTSANDSSDPPPLEDVDIMSECADHLLAGIETTRNLLLLLIWTLSIPQHAHCQRRLQEEVRDFDGSVEAADRLPYLSAVLKESLRLFAPLPASQPRYFDTDMIIDGYMIPAGTIVSMLPYCLHRNPEVFAQPLEFVPERWLAEDATELQKWWWPFSSGARMCTGMHLAMAEIGTLVASIYQNYDTKVPDPRLGISPAITSRFELFWDERYSAFEEDSCVIELRKL